MKPIIFENLRRLMGGGRKKKDKETSFKRSDSFKRISIRKSYLDRGKKKHLQKLEAATQTASEDITTKIIIPSSTKSESWIKANKAEISIVTVNKDATTSKSDIPEKSVIAYGQWLKGIRVDENQPVVKGGERTVIYIPASTDVKPSSPVIRQLSSSPTFHKKLTLKPKSVSPLLQRKESNDSAVEVFPWGDCVDLKKSPLIKRRMRPTSPPSLLPESGAEEMCSLSISLGRIWMDAPQGLAPRSLEMPRFGGLPLPAHHSLDSALKDRKEDPIPINRLLKKSTPPVSRTLSSTSNTTNSTGMFSSKDSGFSFSISIPKLTDFNSSTGAVPVSKGFFRRKRPKPKLSVSRDGYFKRTSGALEIRRNSIKRHSSKKKKLQSSGRKKKKCNSPKSDMYQVVISRPQRSLKNLKLDPMIFVPPEKRRSSVRRKQSFKAGLLEIRNFNLDESGRNLNESTDEGLYEPLPGEFENFSDEQSPCGRLSRISLREDDYDYPSNDFQTADRLSVESAASGVVSGVVSDDDNKDDSFTYAQVNPYVPPGVSPVPRRRPVRRKRSGLSHKRSITYVAKPNIMRAPSTLKRSTKKNVIALYINVIVGQSNVNFLLPLLDARIPEECSCRYGLVRSILGRLFPFMYINRALQGYHGLMFKKIFVLSVSVTFSRFMLQAIIELFFFQHYIHIYVCICKLRISGICIRF
ncbi:hypothetical protein RN001_009827 [Aquatica leii]|uniref:Uncharacterized protein n=1 Tax=Aquatica leii TaxID=1421715 RepID=A0AAN7S8B1_9COLE|nr:hypothetical protein RN001_009827 [Aquatica leii]